MKKPNSYFKLFACCIPVKGAIRGIICDTQRRDYSFISLGLLEILECCKTTNMDDLYKQYSEIDENIIDEYFDWLIAKEYGFFTEEPEKFPEIKYSYETPELINNAIIDIDQTSEHNYSKIFHQLDELGCKFIEIRSYVPLALDYILECLKNTINLRFRNIDLLLKFDQQRRLGKGEIERIFTEFPAVGGIVFHSATENASQTPLPGRTLKHTTQNIHSEFCCGIIDSTLFTINIDTFIESHTRNTCLNKKISIDKNGNIKNCPSMSKSYGNIEDSSLLSVAKNKIFKSFWKITKDQIEVCRDCEFRHICTDCRAFHTKDQCHKKPFKCNYNPYLGKWEN